MRHSPAPCCSSRCGQAGTPPPGSSPAVVQWRRCRRALGRRSVGANCPRIRSPRDRALRTSHQPPRSATAAPHHHQEPAPARGPPPRSGQSRQGSVAQAHRFERAGQLHRRFGLQDFAPPPARSAQPPRAWRRRLPRRRPACASPASHQRSCDAKQPSAQGFRRCALQNDFLEQRGVRVDRTGSADQHRRQRLSQNPCSCRAPRANQGADRDAASCASSMPRPTRARQCDRLGQGCGLRRCRWW